MRIAFSVEVYRRWKDQLNQCGLLYLYAMSGYGKTVQALEFASREYKEWIRLEVTEHMLEDLDGYLKKKSGKTRSLIIIDDLQWLKSREEQQKLLEELFLVLKNQKTIHCMLLGRARLPEYLTVLKVTRQLAVEDFESLELNQEMMVQVMEDSGVVQKRPDLFCKANLVQNYAFTVCEKTTCGYPIALNAYLERLKEPKRDFQTAYRLARADVFTFFEVHIYNIWDTRHREAMMYLSVCDFFDLELAREMIGSDAEEIIRDMNQIGSFMNIEQDSYMRIHPLFREFLREKLSKISDKEQSSLYERAGIYYEKHRNILQALECYKHADLFERMLNLICYLGENADGCAFAKTCYQYMEEFPSAYEERFPKLLAVKAMIYSYHMELEKSDYYLEKLKKKADEEKSSKIGKEAMRNYIRTLIALPHGSADKTAKNLHYFPDFVKENGIQIKNVIATGNMPSMINGGLDLLPWAKKYKVLYPVMKFGSEKIIGKEAIGIADVSVGEHLYELNQGANAIAYLTRGLSEANLKGSIRVQYAATGVMSRVFLADDQWDTAYEIMQNILVRARDSSFLELVPNIQATITEINLQKGNIEQAKLWLSDNPADEHGDFFVTERYRLLVKAKVYVALGRNIEALYILELLDKYVVLFERTYFRMQVQILRSLVFAKTGGDWETALLEAAKTAKSYGYVRILADYGEPLMPLWKKLMEKQDVVTELGQKYSAVVTREMKRMASYYPKYLEQQKTFAAVTKKEVEVLRLVADGLNNQQIAKALSISVATVKFHISNILKKLQVDNRTSAVFCAKQEGLL